MPPIYYERDFLFADGEAVPDHEEGEAKLEERDKTKWSVQGHDTFDDETYGLAIDIDTEEGAFLLATAYLRHLEVVQPTMSSGGQAGDLLSGGVQDRVYVIPPGAESGIRHNPPRAELFGHSPENPDNAGFTAFDLDNLQPSSLEKITVFQQELDAVFEGEERRRTEEALRLMCEVHADQTPRPDGVPYVEHPLEVAREVLKSLEEPDSELVIAALLHDSVEDQAAKLAAKLGSHENQNEETRALRYIGDRFGVRVAGVVSLLTKPDFEAELKAKGKEVNRENKNELYATHIEAAIQDPDVFPVKLFDFAKNALQLANVTDPARRLRLTRKYLPVVEIFIQHLQKDRLVKHEVRLDLCEQLLDAYIKMRSELKD